MDNASFSHILRHFYILCASYIVMSGMKYSTDTLSTCIQRATDGFKKFLKYYGFSSIKPHLYQKQRIFVSLLCELLLTFLWNSKKSIISKPSLDGPPGCLMKNHINNVSYSEICDCANLRRNQNLYKSDYSLITFTVPGCLL